MEELKCALFQPLQVLAEVNKLSGQFNGNSLSQCTEGPHTDFRKFFKSLHDNALLWCAWHHTYVWRGKKRWEFVIFAAMCINQHLILIVICSSTCVEIDLWEKVNRESAKRLSEGVWRLGKWIVKNKAYHTFAISKFSPGVVLGAGLLGNCPGRHHWKILSPKTLWMSSISAIKLWFLCYYHTIAMITWY